MYMRLARTMTVAGAAGAVALALAASAAPAAAAPAAPRVVFGNLYTTSQAGYRTGFGTGWRFRWVVTKVKVFACGDDAAMHGWEANGVVLGANTRRIQAGLSVGCATMGAGAGVQYKLVRRGKTVKEGLLSLSPRAGTWVELSIYYDQGMGRIQFGAKHRHGSVTRSIRIGRKADFLGAQVASMFGKTGRKRFHPIRVGHFIDTHVTSYNVTRGTLLGPWPTNRVLATRDAEPTGFLIARPTRLHGGGSAFAVWQVGGN
jgi:hypothetical protein